MRSKTSFYNAALVRQTAFKRFWPVMAVYALILSFMVVLFVIALNQSYRYSGMIAADQAEDIRRAMMLVVRVGGSIAAMFMGIVLAKICFGYLNQSNTAQFYHALPIKRTTLFWSNYFSGIILFVLPLVFVWLLAWVLIAANGLLGYLDAVMLPALGIVLAVHFFFYTFAVLVGFLTGHGAAHVLIYGVFNFLVIFLFTMVESLFSSYFYGYTAILRNGMPDIISWLTPIVALGKDEYVRWGVIVIYSLAGVGFTALSMLLYKRRSLEDAGDVVAIKALRPIFTVGFAVCFSLLIVVFMSAVISGTGGAAGKAVMSVSLVVLALAGFYIARMLLMKTFKVFSGSLKGMLVFMAFIVLGVCMLQFDLTGFETRLPKEDDVEFVVLTPQNYVMNDRYNARYVALGYLDSDIRSVAGNRLDPIKGDLALLARKHAPGLYEERENIRLAAEIHRWIIDNRSILLDQRYENWQGGYRQQNNFMIVYQMKDGSQIFRNYPMAIAPDALPPEVELLFNSDEGRTKNILYPGTESATAKDAEIVDWYFNYNSMEAQANYSPVSVYRSEQNAQSLLDAIIADVNAGSAGAYYPTYEGAFELEVSTLTAYVKVSLPRDELSYILDRRYIDLGYEDPSHRTVGMGVVITTRCENILRWMMENNLDTAKVFEQRLKSTDLESWHYRYNDNSYEKSYLSAEETKEAEKVMEAQATQ